MPVRKGKAATAVVVCPGSIKPLGCFHPKGKSGVVEAMDIFVQQHPEPGRSRGADIGYFAISGPRRIPVVSMLVIQPGAVDRQIWGAAVIVAGAGKFGSIEAGINRAHRLAHGKGPCRRHDLANECRVGSLIQAHAFVRGTLEHSSVPAEISYQQRTLRIFEHIRIEPCGWFTPAWPPHQL